VKSLPKKVVPMIHVPDVRATVACSAPTSKTSDSRRREFAFLALIIFVIVLLIMVCPKNSHPAIKMKGQWR